MISDILMIKGTDEKKGISYTSFHYRNVQFVSAEHMGLSGLRAVNWQIKECSGYIMTRKCNCCVRWHQPQNEKKVSSGVLPDWLLGRWSLISIQLRGKWRACVFGAAKKITLRRQNLGCTAVYFNYSFQNYNYQMPSFHFLQIRGLSCWTWHHEKAKKFTRNTFCLSDNWISSDSFFLFNF